jgi:hypothetical protein
MMINFYLKMKMKQNTRNSNTKIIHINTKCSQCGQSPIEGIRYYCLKCLSYNLCSKCEKKYGEKHGHPLLMLRRPQDIDKYNLNKIEDEVKIDHTKYHFKCINLKKEYTTKNNNNFIPIEIVIKNTGDESWPTPCFFSCQEESDVKGERVKLFKCSGKQGEEIKFKIKINLNNIKKTGIYKSVWIIKTENGDKLGEKIVFVVKDIFDKDLNLKEKGNKNKNEVKDFRDELEKNVREIKQQYDILFSTPSIRNALIRTKGNKENAIKILYTEQKLGKYHHF